MGGNVQITTEPIHKSLQVKLNLYAAFRRRERMSVGKNVTALYLDKSLGHVFEETIKISSFVPAVGN